MDKCNKIIQVDSFEISGSIITAFSIVDGEDKDWSINKDDFETWADQNEMREWEYDRPGANDCPDVAVHGEYQWHEIYDGHEIMCDFLRQYIAHLYIMESLDIETPLKQILSTHKKAI